MVYICRFWTASKIIILLHNQESKPKSGAVSVNMLPERKQAVHKYQLLLMYFDLQYLTSSS